MRLDQYLAEKGMAPSRERAHAMIMAGIVYLDEQKVTKAGTKVPDDAKIEVRGNDLPYVSRGGLKLEKAMQVFPILLEGKVCMDVGASTGGFTDCMLQNGASKVYAVDVGYGQLAWKLRSDDRVVVMERTNIRHLKPEALEDKIQFFSIDVSFISLKLVLPVMAELTEENSEGVCLVKPQFEAGKDKVGKNGVVRETTTHYEVLVKAAEYAKINGFSVLGVAYSPIKGPKGNIEFLFYLSKAAEPQILPLVEYEKIAKQAYQDLQGEP